MIVSILLESVFHDNRWFNFPLKVIETISMTMLLCICVYYDNNKICRETDL